MLVSSFPPVPAFGAVVVFLLKDNPSWNQPQSADLAGNGSSHPPSPPPPPATRTPAQSTTTRFLFISLAFSSSAIRIYPSLSFSHPYLCFTAPPVLPSTPRLASMSTPRLQPSLGDEMTQVALLGRKSAHTSGKWMKGGVLMDRIFTLPA